MKYRKERELTRLRHDLRQFVSSEAWDLADRALSDLSRLAEDEELRSNELDQELERWRLRIDLLAS